MRLFIGSFIDKEIFKFLLPEIRDDFGNSIGGRWVNHENLHFTWKFLGDTDSNLLQDIKKSLDNLLKTFDSTLIFRSLGVFPNPKRARVLWAGIENPDGQLSQIHRNIEDALLPIGFEKEKRKFKPHLTLIRPKFTNNPDFKNVLDSYRDKEFGMMTNFRINLIESKLTPKGAIYRPMA